MILSRAAISVEGFWEHFMPDCVLEGFRRDLNAGCGPEGVQDASG